MKNPSASPRIAHVMHLLPHGGVAVGLRETLPRLNRAFGRHEVLCLAERGSYAERIEELGVPVLVSPVRDAFDIRGILRLRRLLRERNYDCLHLRIPEIVLPAMLASARLPIRRIVAAHGIWDEFYQFQTPLQRALHKRCVRNADAVLTVSRAVADMLVALTDVERRKIRTIYNGVRFPAPDFDRVAVRRRLRARLGLAEDVPVVGMIARPCRAKRHSDLVDAAALVHQAFPKVRFVVVGGGRPKHVEKLLRRIEERRMQDVVLYQGEQPDAEEWNALFDIGVLCSEREGFGLALVEYLAHGLPVVVTDIPTFRELLQDGENALFAEVRNPPSLAAALLRLLEKPDLAARLRENAPKAVSHLTWDATAEKMAALYRDVLSE